MRQGVDFSAARDFMMRIRAAARRRILTRDRAFYTAFSRQKKDERYASTTCTINAPHTLPRLRGRLARAARRAPDKFSSTRACAAAKQMRLCSAFILHRFSRAFAD